MTINRQLLFIVLSILFISPQTGLSDEGKKSAGGGPRVIVFGAHPDDCEIRAGGSAMNWTRSHGRVKFVSMTNGDIGHWKMSGGQLAKRRKVEIERAAEVLGVDSTILDIHDGELMPTLENRRAVTRLIRNWKADIVITHRTNDYHPDHRYTGVLVQDSAYMVTVPFFCPDTPHLTKNPIFLHCYDRFKQPAPFKPDVVVSIDDVIDKKISALCLMESQFVERGCGGSDALTPKNAQEKEAAQERVRKAFRHRSSRIAEDFRDKLIELYGEEKGKRIKYAEAFQVCEYGRQPSQKELKRLFGIK